MLAPPFAGPLPSRAAIMAWATQRRKLMPLMFGFGALEKLPWERINDKIERRVLAGKHGMIVWWKVKAGAHAGAHQTSARADRLDAQRQDGLPHRQRAAFDDRGGCRSYSRRR